MTKQKLLCCFIICLLAFTQMAFAGNGSAGLSVDPGEPVQDNTAVNSVERTLVADIFSCLNISVSHEEVNDDDLLCKAYFRFRKKSKKLPSYSIRIKPPYREIEPAPVFVHPEGTYSKPWFLSHLHYFLFRLTPF